MWTRHLQQCAFPFLLLAACAHAPEKSFNVVEATIPEMQQAMAACRRRSIRRNPP
jgi:hypothetical protein